MILRPVCQAWSGRGHSEENTRYGESNASSILKAAAGRAALSRAESEATMGRKKLFVRDEVLRAALQVFWRKGYADASLHDLEEATGVNKSGLYSEFANKLELFLAALRHYLEHRGAQPLLRRQPLGLRNLRSFLEIGEACTFNCRGCFSVNSMRELNILPREAVVILEKSQSDLRSLVAENIRAASPEADAGALADLVMTFFSGLCIEQNLPRDPKVTRRRVRGFLKLLEAA